MFGKELNNHQILIIFLNLYVIDKYQDKKQGKQQIIKRFINYFIDTISH